MVPISISKEDDQSNKELQDSVINAIAKVLVLHGF